MNLFINSNGQELLKEMKPALKTELTQHLKRFMNHLFEKIPVEQWYD
jgi:Haemolymph juvenile hormone binding protein (JHBP)